MNINDQFILYCIEGNLEKVEGLLKNDEVDPSIYNNYIIRWASENGHVEIVKILLNDDRVNIHRGLENPTKECKLLIERFIKAKNAQQT